MASNATATGNILVAQICLEPGDPPDGTWCVSELIPPPTSIQPTVRR